MAGHDMSLREIQTDIGLADGCVEGCERTDTNLAVLLKAWNEQMLRVVFHEVLLVRDFVPGDVSGLYEYDGNTELLGTALSYTYDKLPDSHPYRHYVFLNNDGQPCLDIVAAGMKVQRG
jgi:hypothetical protein